MHKATCVILALGLVAATTAFASNAVRISQLYGGGGGFNPTNGYYQCDYVELFNNSNQPVSIGGWSVQFSGAAGANFAVTVNSYVFIPEGTVIQPCGYYLIKGECAPSGGRELPVTPDLVWQAGDNWNPFNFTPINAKAALFPDTVRLRTCAQAQAVAIDLVGWGTANCFETTVAPAGNDQSVLARRKAGAVDCDNNSIDFVVAAQPWPMHNSASPPNPECLAPLVGACCLPPLPGACLILSQAECLLQSGIYLGDCTTCVPDPCPATPAEGTSWGRLKTIYR